MNISEIANILSTETLLALMADFQLALDYENESEERYDWLTGVIVDIRQELSKRDYATGLLPSVME